MRQRPKRDALRFIESQVPLIKGELVHDWHRLLLQGCGVCEVHDGFECLHCRRVVDYEIDTPLYDAIETLLEPDQ